MGHANGVITAPVNTDDVGATIGLSSHDVWTLCTYNEIQRWSRNKPMRSGGPGTLTDSGKKSLSYGLINVPYFTSCAEMCKFMAGNGGVPANGLQPEYFMAGLPRLGIDYARLDDFVNYWHDAPAPIGPWGSTEIVAPSTGDFFLLFPMGPDSDKCIRLVDISIDYTGVYYFDPSKAYFGVGFVKGTTYKVATQTTTLSQIMAMGASVPIAATNLAAMVGDGWTVFTFIGNLQMSFQTAPAHTAGSYFFVPFTFAKKDGVTIRKSEINLGVVFAVYYPGGNLGSTADARDLFYSFSIKNNDATAVTLSLCTVEYFTSAGTSIGKSTVFSTATVINAGAAPVWNGSFRAESMSTAVRASYGILSFQVAGKTYSYRNDFQKTPPVEIGA